VEAIHMTDDQQIKELTAERRALEGQLEVERLRLAVCGVAAHGAGDEPFAGMRPEYDSDALRATRLVWKNYNALRKAVNEYRKRVHADEAAGEWTAGMDAAFEHMCAVLDNPLTRVTASAAPEPEP
jgi:hypothetical protein